MLSDQSAKHLPAISQHKVQHSHGTRLGVSRQAPITVQHRVCWGTFVCMPDNLPLLSCYTSEPAGLKADIA